MNADTGIVGGPFITADRKEISAMNGEM